MTWEGAALLSSTTTYCGSGVGLSTFSGHKSRKQDYWRGVARRKEPGGGLWSVRRGEGEVDHRELEPRLGEALGDPRKVGLGAHEETTHT